MNHRPPSARGGTGRQNSMARNPAQYPQLFSAPRGGTAPPLISNMPLFTPQMAAAPNRQRAPLLTTLPNQTFLPGIYPNPLPKLHQSPATAAVTAAFLQQSGVPTPSTLSHMRTPMPPVAGHMIHPPAFPPGGIPSFQPGALGQQPPPFVPTGQPQPQVPFNKQPAQAMFPPAATNHPGPQVSVLKKPPSKAIKIIDPDTRMEVDTNAAPSTVPPERTNVSVLSSTERDPVAENRKKEFKEKVTSTMGQLALTNGSSAHRGSGPNAIIREPQLPPSTMNIGTINLQVEPDVSKHSYFKDLGKGANFPGSSFMSTHANAKEFTPSSTYPTMTVTHSHSADNLTGETAKISESDAPVPEEKAVETQEKAVETQEKAVETQEKDDVSSTAGETVESEVKAEEQTPVQSTSEPGTHSEDQPQAEPPAVEIKEETKVVENKVEPVVGSASVEPVPHQPETTVAVPCATPSLSSGSGGSITNEDRPSSFAATDLEKPPPAVVAPTVEQLTESPLPNLGVKLGQVELHSVLKQRSEIEPEPKPSPETGPSSEPPPPPPPTTVGVEVTDTQDLPPLKPVPGELQLDRKPPPLVKEVKPVVPKEADSERKTEAVPGRTMSEPAVRDRGGKRSPMSDRPLGTRKETDRTQQKQTKQDTREAPEQPVPGHQKAEKLARENSTTEKKRRDKSPGEEQMEKKLLVNGETSDKEHRQVYNRDFLLQFRKKFLEPPHHLLNSEVYRSPARDGTDMFQPFLGGMHKNAKSGRSVQKRVITVNREEVQLNKAENRWVRPSERAKEQSEEEKETVEVFRKFQGILNKLTPQKFKDLAEQALGLKINSEERLRGCIDKIFKKALEEPNFSVAYANLCRVMSQIKVEVAKVEDGKETQCFTTFRRELLTKCQREFEKDKKDDEEREAMLAAINEAGTAEVKQAKKAELEVWHTKARSRSLGNIRFIGELFKLKMLSEGIMHECIYRLLRSGSDEESLECFCRLITTTGKELDHEQAKVRLDQYFDRIDEIRKKKKISSRIRFMLQDVLDLRKNEWVPRHQESLKTIDQIHYEAQLEKEKEKEMIRQVANVPPKGGRGRDMQDKGRALKPQGGSDEWRTKESAGRRDSKPDINRIQGILKRDRGKETTAGFRPQKWGSKPQGSSTPLLEAKGDRATGKTPLRQRPTAVGSSRAPQAAPHRVAPAPDSSKERKAAIKLVAQMSNPPSVEVPSTQPVMDEAVMKRKTVCIIQELEQTRDYREAMECVQEMNCPDMLNMFVNQAINHSLELTSNTRKMVGKLFQVLLHEDILSTEQFQAGCVEVLGFTDDLEVDIPKFWDYMGEMWSPAVYSNHFSLTALIQMVRDAEFPHKVAVCTAKVLSVGMSVFGKEKTLDVWTKSLLAWRELGDDEDDVRELFARNGLELLLSRDSSGSIEDLPYLKDLSILFRTTDQSNDDILTWIEKNCSVRECCTPRFIHCLTQAVVGASTTGEGSTCIFSDETFNCRLLLLKKHVDENELLQLEILYAIQVAVTKLKHPPELLQKMFGLLYDVEVVSESVFRSWKDSGSEEYGRGVALQAASGFFEWLALTECESDPET